MKKSTGKGIRRSDKRAAIMVQMFGVQGSVDRAAERFRKGKDPFWNEVIQCIRTQKPIGGTTEAALGAAKCDDNGRSRGQRWDGHPQGNGQREIPSRNHVQWAMERDRFYEENPRKKFNRDTSLVDSWR